MGDIHTVIVGTGKPGEADKSIASLGPFRKRISSITHLKESKSASRNVNIKVREFTGSIEEAIPLEKHEPFYLFLQVGEKLDGSILDHLHRGAVQITDGKGHGPLLVSKEVLMETAQRPYKVPFIEALIPALALLVNAEGKSGNPDDLIHSGSTKEVRVKMEYVNKYKVQSEGAGPSLSVMLSAFNSEKWIDTAISSCLLQTTSFLEVLVIDDGSTDSTPDRLKEWEREGVRVFRCSNSGKSKALNKLIPNLKADYVLELDADDWLDPDACQVIRTLLGKLSRETVCLYGNLRCWREKGDKLEYKAEKQGKKVHDRKELLGYPFPLGPRIYRTLTLKAVGGFPIINFADGRMYEDVSMLARLLKHGKLQYNDFTVYNVREHAASMTRRNRPGWSDFLNVLPD